MIVDILHLFVFVVTGLRNACFEPHHPLAAVGAEPAAAAEQERKRIAGLAQQQQQPFSFWFVAFFLLPLCSLGSTFLCVLHSIAQ